MVYIKNGKVKGLTKKVALPLALAASAFTPVMADTTLKLVGPEGNKIAFDQTKQVAINMTSNDNVSFVEVNIELPAGLQYVEGSFKKADIEALKGHQYKVSLTPKGFHVAIYSDNLDSMGELSDQTIGTFDVKANTKLSGNDPISMTIVDLTDKDANQVKYNNKGKDYIEGAEGDNSIGTGAVAVDKSILPGTWKVTATAANLADGVLAFNPLFDAQTVSIEIENDIAQIAGMEFRLILPQGLALDESSLALTDRKEDQTIGKQIIVDKESGENTNDYKIFILGGDKPFKGSEGAVLTFNLKADMSLATDPEKDFSDEILFENIIVTDIYSNAVKSSDQTIKVQNLNEKARYELTGALNEIEEKALEEPLTRVYDYKDVLDARKAANSKLDELYQAGTLGYQDNPEIVGNLVETYENTLNDISAENINMLETLSQQVADLREQLEAANQPQTVAADSRALAPGDETSTEPDPEAEGDAPEAEPAAVVVKAQEAIAPAQEELAAALSAATAAIDKFEAKIDELFNEKSAEDAERYDGALLNDENQLALKALSDEANAAIAGFEITRNDVNGKNQQTFNQIVSEDLAKALDDVNKYVENLSIVGRNAETGPYANYENLPEVKEAVAAAQKMIEETLPNAIQAAADEIALPFDEGINEVLDLLQQASDAIDNVKEVADHAKEVNDALTTNINEALANVEKALDDAEDRLEEIREADEYKYIDSNEKTTDLMKAIDQRIADLNGLIDAIEKDVNDEQGYDDQSAEAEKIAGFIETLNNALASIDEETYPGVDGEELVGLDKQIEDAVATYDKYHQRGDANMDGRVSLLDYNLIMQYVREEKNVEEVTPEQLSQLNVVQEKSFGTDIEINITDAVGALKIYLNDGSDEGLKLGDRYYSSRALTGESQNIMATSQMVGGVKRIALQLADAQQFTAAQLDVMLGEGARIVNAQLGDLNNGHQLFVGNVNDGRQRVVISNDQLKAFNASVGTVLFLDVEGDVEFSHVLFSTLDAESVAFDVVSGATGIAGVNAAAGEGEQVYSLGGRLMNALKKGVNIIRRADGSTQKVIKK